MNFTALANAVISSTEFSQKYGSSLTQTQFVERIYQNALGRNATMSELSSWLTQLAAGTTTEAGLAIAVSQSAEHIASGNVYQLTNNTYNTSGTYTLDHTTDTAVAAAIVQNLYQTALGRAADASGLATYSGDLLNGTLTQTQIAAVLTSSQEFLNKYGSMSNADFVSQIFANGLGRLPSTAEAAYWTAELTSGTVLKADLVAAMAQSPDHLECLNGSTVIQVTGTGNIIYAAGDTLDFAPGASGTVDSSGNTINLSPNDTVTVNGNGATINAVAGDTIIVAQNITATVNGSGAMIDVASGDTITMGTNASNTYAGSGATIVAGVGTTLTFASNASDTVSGSGLTINLASGDTITTGANASDKIGGSGGTIVAGSGTTLTFASNVSDTVTGSGVTLNLANGDDITASNAIVALLSGAAASIRGDSNAIAAGANASVSVSGNTNTVTATGAGVVVDLSGAANTAAISSGAVTLEAGVGNGERQFRRHQAGRRRYTDGSRQQPDRGHQRHRQRRGCEVCKSCAGKRGGRHGHWQRQHHHGDLERQPSDERWLWPRR